MQRDIPEFFQQAASGRLGETSLPATFLPAPLFFALIFLLPQQNTPEKSPVELLRQGSINRPSSRFHYAMNLN